MAMQREVSVDLRSRATGSRHSRARTAARFRELAIVVAVTNGDR